MGHVKAPTLPSLSSLNHQPTPSSNIPTVSPSTSTQSLSNHFYQFSRPSLTFLEPSCHTEYTTVYEEECVTVDVRECDGTYEGATQYRQECAPSYRGVCEEEYQTSYEDECETSYQDSCEAHPHTTYKTQCDQVLRRAYTTSYARHYTDSCMPGMKPSAPPSWPPSMSRSAPPLTPPNARTTMPRQVTLSRSLNKSAQSTRCKSQ